MKIENVEIKNLIQAEYNPRKLSTDQYEHIKSSLIRFGIVDPVIVNKNPDRFNVIIGGHQRTKVWKDLGNDEIPVYYVDLPFEKEQELNIRLNKNTGEFDFDLLNEFFEKDDLLDWGFDDIDFPEIEELEPEETTGDDEIPEQVEPKTVRGDIYVLGGKHRVMCGDSTMIDDVEKLMDGENADMVFTDPPYNIDYSDMSGEFEKIKNDKMSDNDFLQFLASSINWGANTLYICCSWQYAHLFKEAMEKAGRPAKSNIIWDKVNPAQNLDKYYKQHEFIFYHGKFGGEKTLRGDIWEIKRQRNTVHPTMKPIELIEMAILDQPKAKIISDSFLGSGSTLIACEKTNRKCYGMELDEKYCDVIVQRYVDFCIKNNREWSVVRNGEDITKDYG